MRGGTIVLAPRDRLCVEFQDTLSGVAEDPGYLSLQKLYPLPSKAGPDRLIRWNLRYFNGPVPE